MPLQRLVAYGPPGSSISIGPTSLDLPAWVQAVGSIAAILIAIWLSGRTERKEYLDRVRDDACFASYVQQFLNSIGATIQEIAASINDSRHGDEDRAPRTLAQVCSDAFEAYENRVLERVKKFVELPLTDWPDIELANAFYDASLQMRSDLQGLKTATSERVASEVKAEAERLRSEAARRQNIARAAEEEEDEAERWLGDMEGDDVIALPPRGQRRSFVSQMLHNQDDDDDSEYHFRRALAEEADYDAYLERAAISAQSRQDREGLDRLVFAPLLAITAKWANGDQPLNRALQRHQVRAIAAGVALTYDTQDGWRGPIERWRLARAAARR